MTARLLILLTIFSSCVGKLRIPDNVIKPEKMQNVLRDIIKADALAQELSQRDSSTDLRTINIEMYNNIFALYSITSAEFDSSYKYYERHPSLMLTMIDSLNQRQIRAFKAKDRKYNPDSTIKTSQ